MLVKLFFWSSNGKISKLIKDSKAHSRLHPYSPLFISSFTYFLLLCFLPQSCLRVCSVRFCFMPLSLTSSQATGCCCWFWRKLLALIIQEECSNFDTVLLYCSKYPKALALHDQRTGLFVVFQWVSLSWTITPVRASGWLMETPISTAPGWGHGKPMVRKLGLGRCPF